MNYESEFDNYKDSKDKMVMYMAFPTTLKFFDGASNSGSLVHVESCDEGSQGHFNESQGLQVALISFIRSVLFKLIKLNKHLLRNLEHAEDEKDPTCAKLIDANNLLNTLKDEKNPCVLDCLKLILLWIL